MKYLIRVREINNGVLEVEAASEEEALEKAEDGYALGQTMWKDGEYELDVQEIKPRTHIRSAGQER